MNEFANKSLRQQIYHSMQERQTEELLQIWRDNDRQEWSNEAFEVIHTILKERLGNVPEQAAEEVELEEEIEQGAGEGPLHDPAKLEQITAWSKALSWITLIGGGLIFAGYVLYYLFLRLMLSSGQYIGWTAQELESIKILDVVTNFGVALIIFLALQGLAQLIYLMMDTYDELIGRQEG